MKDTSKPVTVISDPPVLRQANAVTRSLMKYILTIFIICLATVSYSQTGDEIEHFYSVKNDNDSTFEYFISFLNKFDSTDWDKSFFCEKAAERVGDYYKSKGNYLKAIAYYDSADAKYRDKLQFCGNGYYLNFIPRRYKVSQCYFALRIPQKALSVLTPYIFDNFGSKYFDSAMTEYYAMTLNSLYTQKQIKNELKSSVDKAIYATYYRWSLDSASKYIGVNCKLKIFGSELELAGFELSSEKNNEVPFYATKEGLTSQFKNLPIYKLLEN